MKHLDRFFFGFLFLAMLVLVVSLVGAFTSFVMAHKIACLIISFVIPVIYFLGWAIRFLVGEER